MATVAGLAKQAGHNVEGSDANLYPPMSTLLEDLEIPVYTPYQGSNIEGKSVDLFIVANVLSRGHEELEAAINTGIPYTSFPDFVGRYILKNRAPVVVTGTHGKTTTTSLIAHVLTELGEEPGYLIGGQPKNLERGFHLGNGQAFAIEGDEYDTAFFDKNSKFLHYRPSFVVFNNLEFDHADIFGSLDDIKRQFDSLFYMIDDKHKIIANVDDDGVRSFLRDLDILDDVTTVSTSGQYPEADYVVSDIRTNPNWSFEIRHDGQTFRYETKLTGHYNIANISQVVATVNELAKANVIQKRQPSDIAQSVSSFRGVKRRLDLIVKKNGIEIYEDFAHHPTAVANVIDGFKKSYPNKRLFVAFEPKNATSRRNLFINDYSRSFQNADKVLIGQCPEDKRIVEADRMNTEKLAGLIGSKAEAYPTNELLADSLAATLRPNDAVIFMSSGSFSGIQYSLIDTI